MTKKQNKGGLVADAAVYSAEALQLAAFVYSDRAEISIKAGKGVFNVSFCGEAPGFHPGDYMNEVLNQQCRLDLAKQNSKAAGMIATKALLSAAGGTKKKA
ncbi:MAG: hypothetical protein NDI60_04670 [Elusimicrobiales bacterium]|nr:hypothetical protein [Elusimicrobiales bacterium]